MVQLHKRAHTIQSATKRTSHMIKNLLQKITLEGERITFTKKPHDPRSLLAEVLEMYQPVARERGIAINVEVVNEPPPISYNRDYMLHIFKNIVGNAKKFTPSAGSIVIRAEAQGTDMVRFTISDTGPGIRPDDIERI